MNNSEGYNFNDLFVFEMANNHQGSIDLGKSIIEMCSELSKKHKIRSAIKFQFRQLESFIHPDYINADEPTHIKRFLSTKLSKKEFKEMAEYAKSKGLITMCTPFDEDSVDVIDEIGFDIIKIGSCSAIDWPLLEKVSEYNYPVIISTGGLEINDVDKIVSFFDHKGIDFAIMHCVSMYPTPTELLELNQIEIFKSRYPNITIGWSTHEDPNDSDIVMLAHAKGARIFEKHVGVTNKELKNLNAYSATLKQLDNWIEKYKKAKSASGSKNHIIRTDEEVKSINELRRGVYAKKTIKKGDEINLKDVFFAMPYNDNQFFSGIWKEGLVTKKKLKPNEALMMDDLIIPHDKKRLILQHHTHKIKAMLNEAKIQLGSDFQVEFSHHYGLEKFQEYGAVLITLVNRLYCKKILIQTPGQEHPSHFHKKKEETFYVLSGELHTEIDGVKRKISPGEQVLVLPGVWHSFNTKTGVIFEELSTTHYNDDSFYKDKKINKMDKSSRKTYVDHWGRFLLDEKISN